ncbi:response regulator [bacterium AH-315-N03]|nr:response regulator [bacterium AH-315-N03]
MPGVRDARAIEPKMAGLVLLAESDPFNLRLLQELCEEAGFSVVTAGDGDTALNVIARQRPALIVLDASLITADGADVLEVLQSDPALAPIPVLLCSDAGDEEGRRRGLDLGAHDFVTRPYRVHEVEARIRNALRLAEAEEVAAAARRTLSAPPTEGPDPLTHAGGAVQLRITLEYEATRAVRYEHAITCVVMRISNFDEIVAASEDSAAGLVVQLATGVRRAIRSIDHLFRSDTDEFTLLLPETTSADAGIVLDRLRAAARDASSAIEPRPTTKLGSAAIEPGSEITDGDALWRAARAALVEIA